MKILSFKNIRLRIQSVLSFFPPNSEIYKKKNIKAIFFLFYPLSTQPTYNTTTQWHTRWYCALTVMSYRDRVRVKRTLRIRYWKIEPIALSKIRPVRQRYKDYGRRRHDGAAEVGVISGTFDNIRFPQRANLLSIMSNSYHSLVIIFIIIIILFLIILCHATSV